MAIGGRKSTEDRRKSGVALGGQFEKKRKRMQAGNIGQ